MANTRPIDLVLSRLRGVKKTAGGHTARCQNHDDHENSLSLSEGTVRQ